VRLIECCQNVFSLYEIKRVKETREKGKRIQSFYTQRLVSFINISVFSEKKNRTYRSQTDVSIIVNK